QYPYAASGSSLVASLLPAWAQAGKAEEVLARLDDSGVRPRLLEEMTQNLKRRGGADSLLFTSSDAPELLGKRLSEVAREKNLPVMIHASSDFPARTIGIPERGLLRTGYFADVIAFDPATVADQSTYEHPNELAVGMKYVIVNGKLAVEDGKYNGALVGRPLRKELAAK